MSIVNHKLTLSCAVLSEISYLSVFIVFKYLPADVTYVHFKVKESVSVQKLLSVGWDLTIVEPFFSSTLCGFLPEGISYIVFGCYFIKSVVYS